MTHLQADIPLRDTILRWTVCFPYASKYALRKGRRVRPDRQTPDEEASEKTMLGPIANSLPLEQRQAVLAANHLPTAVALQISQQLRRARDLNLVSDYVMATIDQNTQLLVDYVGGCERICKTPIPFAYMVHVRRALIIYCLLLPFALVGEFSWLTVPITFILAYVFIGIEEIGVEIEDPFGSDENDLPLELICQTIERNLLDMIGRPAIKPEIIVERTGE